MYNDGEREDVNLRTLDILMRNEAWCSQVLVLQGYVPAASTQSGRFSDQGVKTVSSDDSTFIENRRFHEYNNNNSNNSNNNNKIYIIIVLCLYWDHWFRFDLNLKATEQRLLTL